MTRLSRLRDDSRPTRPVHRSQRITPRRRQLRRHGRATPKGALRLAERAVRRDVHTHRRESRTRSGIPAPGAPRAAARRARRAVRRATSSTVARSVSRGPRASAGRLVVVELVRNRVERLRRLRALDDAPEILGGDRRPERVHRIHAAELERPERISELTPALLEPRSHRAAQHQLDRQLVVSEVLDERAPRVGVVAREATDDALAVLRVERLEAAAEVARRPARPAARVPTPRTEPLLGVRPLGPDQPLDHVRPRTRYAINTASTSSPARW